MAGAVIAAFLMWPSARSNGGAAASRTDVTVEYVVAEPGGDGAAPANSPIEVKVRLPWRAGDNSTIFSSVGLEFLDDAGNPALFGPGPLGPVEMKPALDVADWFYRGSVPSAPGTYHPRLTLKRLFGGSEPETVEAREPAFRVVPDSGEPLRSGYVFDDGPDLWLVSTSGDRQRRITFFGSGGELASDPAWSPDGKLIAFTHANQLDMSSLPSTEIRVMSADGSGMVTVVRAEPESELAYPAWSSDGVHIYYTVKSGNLTTSATPSHIERVTPATGDRQQLVPSGMMARQVAADGSLVYLQETLDPALGSVKQRIARADARGEGEQILLAEDAFPAIFAPRPSPDGKWIAFSAVNPVQGGGGNGFDFWSWLFMKARSAEAHGAPWDIYMLPTEGGTPSRLTTILDDEARIAWLDNSTLAFMGVKGIHTLKLTPDGKPMGEPLLIHRGADHGGLSWHGP